MPELHFKEKGDALDVFSKGKEEHFSYVERILESANTFKKIAIGSTLIALVATCTATYLSMRSEYVPFIIRADKVTGYVEGVGPIDRSEYSPTEVEKKYFLTEFLKKTRTVPLDPVVYQKNWSDAAAFMTNGSARKIEDISKSQGHFEKLGAITVEPVILGITRLANSEDTYQVRWKEMNFNIGSSVSKVENYIGTFTMKTGQVANETDLYKNPLGIHITDLSFSLENNVTTTNKGER